MNDEKVDAVSLSAPSSDEAAQETVSPPEKEKRVRRRDILNILNFINFSEGMIFADFRNLEDDHRISFPAFPQPCSDNLLDCQWVSPGISMSRIKSYVCDDFLLCDGNKRVIVKAEVTRLDAKGIAFKIPESGYEKSCRQVERYTCEGIEARLIQAGVAFEGSLVDFNAISFKIELEAKAPASLRWVNGSAPVTVLFSRDGEILYSGECLITRMGKGLEKRELVLSPNFTGIRRYRPKKNRSERYSLSPAPAVYFEHPLTGKRVYLQVRDISGGGLCVEEFFDCSVLLPGMLIPEISIEMANQFVLKCKAQVLYRNVTNCDEGPSVRCGIVFLDMDMQDQVKLSAYLYQSSDDRVRICGNIELEELWRFFFETGFIYPSKYLSIEARKEEFKRTYEKLYLGSPTVARHFFYQDKGQIFGHMSMLRFYRNSWLIHHHAASRDGYGLAGVKVLDQVGRYCNDFHSFPATHMDYLMCYYRKENRFPARVFGNIARDIDDPKGSSLDIFAYMHLGADVAEGDAPFQLFPASDEDYEDFQRYYERVSGGLALDALDLKGEDGSDLELAAEYARQGFRRERHVFCLRQEGRLMAVMSLTLADLGMNLSDLTNCVHVFILDRERLLPATLFSGLRNLLKHYAAEDIPILVYPADFLDEHIISYEKQYTLWVVSLEHSDGYFSSIQNTFRRAVHGADDEHNCNG
jgi:hypothetical protein